MLNLIITIVLFFALVYPIAMSFIWIFGALRYNYKRKKEQGKWKRDVKQNEFTVVIPVYNEGKYIRDILEKNLKNAYENLKFLVVNDHSTDNTAEILSKIKDSRLEVINLDENIGKAAVLNYTLKHIETEFFVCLDSDSLAYPNAFSLLNNQINNEEDENVAAYAGSLTVDQENTNSTLLRIQKLEYRSIITMIKRTQDTFLKNILTVSGAFVAYKTEIIKGIGGFDSHNATEDIEITWRLTVNGYRVKFLDDFVAEVGSPSISKNLISQRTRWNLGGIQTASKYRSLLFKKGFWVHKMFLLERFASVLWIYSFIFSQFVIAIKLLFDFPEATTLQTLALPTLAILFTGILLQIIAYRLSKGCKEYVDEFIVLILFYPLVYWFLQPIGYFGALKRFYFNKEHVGKWRSETRKRFRFRKILSSIIDISIFFTIYHVIRVVLFRMVLLLPSNYVIVHYFLILFWMIIFAALFIYFLNVKYSTLSEGILGIKSSRKRSIVYNITSPIVLIIIIDIVINMSNTLNLIKVVDYEVLIAEITKIVSRGGVVNQMLFIPFALALVERYFGIIEKVWRNRQTINN